MWVSLESNFVDCDLTTPNVHSDRCLWPGAVGADLNCKDRAIWQGATSLRHGEKAPDGCDKTVELDWLGIELVAPSCHSLFALAGQRVRR